MFRDVEICLEKTTPDWFWPTRGVALYLDGEQVHSSERAQLRDDKITDMLTNRGIKCLRFRYRPPLSKKRLNEIVAEIEEALK
jgi:very-short-patch-repair endonuclease